MRQTLFVLASFFALATMSSFVVTSLEEFGKAGYYADSLHGRKTASGEKYDRYEFTCAHKTLPFGTKVRVTRLDNKKSVIVRVNDRGPFVEGYVVDISRAAAEEIGLLRDGVTRVKVEVVGASAQARVAAETDGNTKLLLAREQATAKGTRPAVYNTDDPQPASTRAGAAKQTSLYKVDLQQSEKYGYGVQVSTLFDADNVLPMVTKLQRDWPGRVLVSVEKDELTERSTYRIIIGPFADKKSADVQQKSAVRKGYKQCFVVDLGNM